MTTITTITTMTTTKIFSLRFAALAAMSLMTIFATAQVQTVQMNHSNPLAMDMKMVFWSSAEGYTTSTPLGYVQVGVGDSFARDYSGLSGSSEFISEQDLSASGRVSFSILNTGSKTSRIGILGLKENPGGALQVRVDGGKTSLCFPLGYETGEEELRNLVRLIRTKDGQLAAMVTFHDKEGIFKSLLPGIKERICMVVPLQDSDPAKSLQLARDKEGNSFALLLLRDGNTRVKEGGSGKANLGVTVLTPSDKAMAEKIGLTLVLVN
jgi:hypothetical protein